MSSRFEVIVIGGGHAGVEAAWACANFFAMRRGASEAASESSAATQFPNRSAAASTWMLGACVLALAAGTAMVVFRGPAPYPASVHGASSIATLVGDSDGWAVVTSENPQRWSAEGATRYQANWQFSLDAYYLPGTRPFAPVATREWGTFWVFRVGPSHAVVPPDPARLVVGDHFRDHAARGLTDDPLCVELFQTGDFNRVKPWTPGILYDLKVAVGAATVIAGLGGAAFIVRARTRGASNRQAHGLCPKCGYDLQRGMAAGCPECGWNRPS